MKECTHESLTLRQFYHYLGFDWVLTVDHRTPCATCNSVLGRNELNPMVRCTSGHNDDWSAARHHGVYKSTHRTEALGLLCTRPKWPWPDKKCSKYRKIIFIHAWRFCSAQAECNEHWPNIQTNWRTFLREKSRRLIPSKNEASLGSCWQKAYSHGRASKCGRREFWRQKSSVHLNQNENVAVVCLHALQNDWVGCSVLLTLG